MVNINMGRKKKNLIGLTFGRLTVLKEKKETIYIDKFGKRQKIRWVETICKCGNKKNIRVNAILSEHTKSCGCLHKEIVKKVFEPYYRKKISLRGKKIGKLTYIKDAKKENYHGKSKMRRIIVSCDCGNKKEMFMSSFLSNKTKSCGCWLKEVTKKRSTTHGLSGTKFYKTWEGMQQRCYNKNVQSFKNYGGRGIKVCKRWEKFENFRDDMYNSFLKHQERFNSRNTSIDRIDNNGNYTLKNCRWATNIEQAHNKKR
jgi:hypothetical protein